MRILRVIPLLLTIALIWLLDHPIGALPALGRIIDPVNGALAAAEPVHQDFNRSLHLKALQAPVSIWLEDRLVPHIRAQNDHDLYYMQGYIHAYFRLWQMDLQTRAAGGRVSEVAGPKAVEFDRGQRRKGMVWAAGHSLETMERDPRTKAMLDAYRDGINAYIHTLRSPSFGGNQLIAAKQWGEAYRSLPIEYKLMGFRPEDWTNMRTALLMKYMADDLTGKTDDIAFTILRDQLGQEQFDFLFPEKIKGSKPVIPEGTPFAKPSLPIRKVPGDSVWAHFREQSTVGRETFQHSNTPTLQQANDDPAIGSNNWAISGSHTASGKPILCNDPHLGLNLPSLWYEMQLTAPGINVYGASLPGAPGIVIGFNQKISWGFTNNYRDVKDFYEIVRTSSCCEVPPPPPQKMPSLSAHSSVPDTKSLQGKEVSLTPRVETYQFCGKSIPFQKSIEIIKVKGQPDVIDTVLYTLHGPVTYDPSFPDPAKSGKLLACTWMAHRGSNELLATYLLNRAGDYAAFTNAIQHFECPAQNIAYADGAGNIAIWGQGRFINKWKGQGKYVMEGHDSATLWGADIPMGENPHVLNPPQGYVASANQSVTDSTYPYWYNGSFFEWRSWEINIALLNGDDLSQRLIWYQLTQGKYFSVPPVFSCQNGVKHPNNDFEKHSFLQNSNYSDWNDCLSFLLSSLIKSDTLQRFFDYHLPGSYKELDANSSSATKFQIWSWFFYKAIWEDEFQDAPKWPSTERTLRLLQDEIIPFTVKNDTLVLQSKFTSQYFDDKRTDKIETVRDLVYRAFRQTEDSLQRIPATAKQLDSMQHFVQRELNEHMKWYKVKNTSLTHLAKIPAFSYDHLKIGGWSNTINAATGNYGPSWRMIVEMDSIPKAYAVYPGGQSGNPGSPHYGDFIDHWVEGKYFSIQFLIAAITKNPFPYTWTLTP